MKFLLTILMSGFLSGCTTVCAAETDLETVASVNLDKYLGKWFEIASIPQSFSRGCINSQATYALREDGKISVLNECHIESIDGPWKRANGTARVVDEISNAKLKVSFFWPFEGDYWIIELDDGYNYAVVSEPARKYLWILSRTETLPTEVLNELLLKLEKKHHFGNLNELVYRGNPL